MKIGLYGGMANNMYVLSYALDHAGHDVCFIRDRNDHYAFSQPVWEDCPLTLLYNKVNESSSWSWDKWTLLERTHNWRAPEWLADPLEPVNLIAGNIEGNVLEHMQTCDLNIVCGVIPSLTAAKSGVPYFIFPHGGDIRTAAGYHLPKTYNPLKFYEHYKSLIKPLRIAYKNAQFVASHDPTGVGGSIGDVRTRLPGIKFERFSIPMKMESRWQCVQRKHLLKKIMISLNITIPDAENILFVPSRIDFFWKGQDKFFRALNTITDKKVFHTIVSGWGSDFQQMKKMYNSDSITFLQCAVSKPILRDCFKACDLVVDQFTFGTFGTSALEAMSCGTPVMMWIDRDMFKKQHFSIPPVINVQSESEIRQALQDIIQGSIDLEMQGTRIQTWFNENFSYDHAIPEMEKLIKNYFR